MREIGGYIELERTRYGNLHCSALALNCGRACLAYLIEAREIRRIRLPDFLCDSVSGVCTREGVEVVKYAINECFEPVWDFEMGDGEWLYLVDYYGQLAERCVEKATEISGGRLIVDEAQALFRKPWDGVDTIYTPRKFLGIPDGGFLYTDARIGRPLEEDESAGHMTHLLGRVERGASALYAESAANNDRFADEPVKRMSRLTQLLIGNVDVESACGKRLANWDELDRALSGCNRLVLARPKSPFMYPLLVDGGPAVRVALAKKGIYIPTLWPNVLNDPSAGDVAREYARNILPLPIDQRYGAAEMRAIVEALRDVGAAPRELSGKKVAVLGGTLITCEIVRAAKKMGLHATVIDYNPPEESPAKLIADEHALISVADTDAVAAYVRDHNIDGVTVGYADSLLPWFADICEKAGLPCYGTREQFETFTDKGRWKALCRGFDVPTAKEYGESLLDLPEPEVPLPLLVKPADGSGSRGVTAVRQPSELEGAIERAKAFSKSGRVIVEDYLEGPEVTVFWLFIEGERRVFLLGNRLVKRSQGDALPLPVGYTFPAAVLPRYLKEVAPRVDAMLESQGVRDGMMFMQCVIVDGLPHVYDIGYRLTGSLEHHLTEACSGYSPMEMLLRYAVTGRMTNDPYVWEKVDSGLHFPCYNVSILMKPGTLGSFIGLDVLDSMEGVIAYDKAHLEGELLPPEAKGELRQIALRVLGRVEETRDLESAMLQAQEAVQVVSSNGEDLKLPGVDAGDFGGLLY